ncbi:alpha/beta fold hydrolase [Pseudomonas sp. NA-150]|uniref:alpha/beta fold hydrolase n=1 Tax=Pseudomonas sp. NA-150 TaxID=3367525 RepID=UPI0037C7F675
MKSITAGVLDIAYLEVGPAGGAPVVLLHGFPYDVQAYDTVAARLASAGRRCLIPYLRGYGATRFLAPQTLRSGEQAALGADLLAFLDALNIERAVLAGYDWGGRAACIVAALWPERVTGLVSCGIGYNIQNIANAGTPAVPETEHRLWYQYYLHGQRGHAGLTANRESFCRLLWQMWSPTWTFDEPTFDQTATSFANSDFVDVVTHSYRHRFALVDGDPAYQHIENRLAAKPLISVPTVVLEGADDGVNPPKSVDVGARQFTGPYRRQIVSGIGHNFPQESPDIFAEAVLSLPSSPV